MKNKSILFTVVMFLAAFALGSLGCSTVDGVGKDVEKLGEAVQDASD